MLIVEPVRNTDIDPVARLALDTLKERYDAGWLADHATNVRTGTFLVARDVPTNQVVGFAIADRADAEGHLLALAVDANRRGQGIGRALLKDVRNRMARSGAHSLRLDVRWDDPMARRYYEGLGFSPTGIHERVYADGTDALEMVRPLR